MGNRCNQEVFDKGHSVATLDACMQRAETWVQAVAKESGQLVDWHYSGGIANVLYVGDHANVIAAVNKLRLQLEGQETIRNDGECGSCSGPTHRAGRILNLYDVGDHGPYRAGDEVPPGTLAVDKRRTIRADLRRRDGLLLGRAMVPEGTPFILSLASGKYFDHTTGAQYVERRGQGYV